VKAEGRDDAGDAQGGRRDSKEGAIYKFRRTLRAAAQLGTAGLP